MDLLLATLGSRPTRKHSPADELISGYARRITPFCRLQIESFPTEDRFFAVVDRQQARTRPVLVLFDSRGPALSTEQFAAWLKEQRDQGVQRIVFAIGPADGWSPAARERATRLLSFGPITLPHELAAVLAAEQIYRAFTIIHGHPYHLGHTN